MAKRDPKSGRFVGGGKGKSRPPKTGSRPSGLAAGAKRTGAGIGPGSTGLVLSGDWDIMTKTLDTFEGTLAREIERATEISAIKVRDEIRTRIDDRKYEPNAPRTLILKNDPEGLPLAGKTQSGAALLKSLAYVLLPPFAAIIGVNRFARWKGRVNVAQIVHDGITIKVTPKMRQYFKFLAFKYSDLGFKPLHPRTTRIVIPPRPFIGDVMDDKGVQAEVRKRWEEAVDNAFGKAHARGMV